VLSATESSTFGPELQPRASAENTSHRAPVEADVRPSWQHASTRASSRNIAMLDATRARRTVHPKPKMCKLPSARHWRLLEPFSRSGPATRHLARLVKQPARRSRVLQWRSPHGALHCAGGGPQRSPTTRHTRGQAWATGVTSCQRQCSRAPPPRCSARRRCSRDVGFSDNEAHRQGRRRAPTLEFLQILSRANDPLVRATTSQSRANDPHLRALTSRSRASESLSRTIALQSRTSDLLLRAIGPRAFWGTLVPI
jgi:hypothetical protein